MRMYFQHCIKTQTSLVICLNNSLTNHQYSVVGIFMLKNRRKDENEECGGIALNDGQISSNLYDESNKRGKA